MHLFLTASLSLIFFAYLSSIDAGIIGTITRGDASENDSVTYPGIGTFSKNEYTDKKGKGLGFLPFAPPKMNLSLLLYTRSNRQASENASWNSEQRQIESLSSFDPSKQTKFIIHGFSETVNSKDWMFNLKDAILDKVDANVFVVDWSGGNQDPYGQAVANVRVVGPMIAIQIQKLVKNRNANLSSFHIIGHSLGAHVAGFTGKFLNGTVGQITGLDPAGPLLQDFPPRGRFWYTDARFVDAVHTDAKPLIGLGMAEPCGTVDIYPNGAKTQPGCSVDRLDSFKDGTISNGTGWLLGCEHYRSYLYYTEAIQRGPIPATRAYGCKDYETFQKKENATCHQCGPDGLNCVYLGLKSIEYQEKAKGKVNRKKFYLSTKGKEPYFG